MKKQVRAFACNDTVYPYSNEPTVQIGDVVVGASVDPRRAAGGLGQVAGGVTAHAGVTRRHGRPVADRVEADVIQTQVVFAAALIHGIGVGGGTNVSSCPETKGVITTPTKDWIIELVDTHAEAAPKSGNWSDHSRNPAHSCSWTPGSKRRDRWGPVPTRHRRDPVPGR